MKLLRKITSNICNFAYLIKNVLIAHVLSHDFTKKMTE